MCPEVFIIKHLQFTSVISFVFVSQCCHLSRRLVDYTFYTCLVCLVFPDYMFRLGPSDLADTQVTALMSSSLCATAFLRSLLLLLCISWQHDFTGWGCQPHAQPPIWRTVPLYVRPPETGWPSYTPRHWIPILVVFYDTHGQRWDYSYPPVTTRRTLIYNIKYYFCYRIK
jgi:hypothetical protein